MNHARIAILISFLASICAIVIALIATPAMRYSLFSDASGSEGIATFILTTALIAPIAGWPWLRAYILAKSSTEEFPAWIFALIAPVICLWFAASLSTTPSEGIGYSLIFCIFGVWLLYALTRVFAK